MKGGKKCTQVCWKVGKVDLQSVPPKNLQGYGVHFAAECISFWFRDHFCIT